MTRPVTDKQRGVLAAVQKFWEVRGVAPSLADLAADLELSRATIHEHLQALKRKGQLEHIEGVGRSWEGGRNAASGGCEVVLGCLEQEDDAGGDGDGDADPGA